MQNTLLSFPPYLFVCHARARGKTPHTKERMQPSCITPPTGHSRELMCRGVAPNTMLASCVACAGLFSSWCVANSEQVYCTSGAL